MFQRTLKDVIKKRIGSRKAIILIGPRQVGKTTLIQNILESKEYLHLLGDDPTVRQLLTEPNTEQIRAIIGKYNTIFVDEAQRIPKIGITLKIIIDQFKDVQVFVSGSSSFDLSNQINEPLTGRKWEYKLLPISWEEFEANHGYLKSEMQLETRLVYGFYPDVLNNPGEESEILSNLVSSYLYKDILALANIRKPEVLDKLVQALAFQIGNEVNYNELANITGIDKNTVSRYIDMLEKGFVIFKIGTFSRNLRTEIKTNKKIYFYDNGIRNLIIGNLKPINLRNDIGALWENFLISERYKQNIYKQKIVNSYYWRSKQKQEVDFVEEYDGLVFGYEFKWKSNKRTKLPKTFVDTYKAHSHVIDRTNFREFVISK